MFVLDDVSVSAVVSELEPVRVAVAVCVPVFELVDVCVSVPAVIVVDSVPVCVAVTAAV